MIHVDGDDMTTDWWALPGAMGGYELDEGTHLYELDNATVTVGATGDMNGTSISGDTLTLYGTIHDGQIHGVGLAIADVPSDVKAWQWDMAKHMAELAEKVRQLSKRLDDMEADS